jgi:hypothetical protein
VWVVIPNKSSIYQRKSSTEVNQTFWKAIEDAKLGPNLFQELNKNKSLIKDLYAPNDSHLSTNGYLLIGNIISQQLL